MSTTITIEDVAEGLATDICAAMRHAADKREIAEICGRALSRWGNYNCDETRRLIEAAKLPEPTTESIGPGGGHYDMSDLEPLKVGRRHKWPYELTATYKYMQRFEKKNGAEDIRKGAYLLERYANHLEGKE